jgi:DNA-binding transcriptional LysR family regulator
MGALDLNLLVVFEALWRERHVTRAAHRVGMSQSAFSHALKRLREQLDDELFQASPRGMLPTPRAQELAHPISDAMVILRRGLDAPTSFDPRALKRTFTIGTTDYGELIFLPELAERVGRLAPQVTLNIRPLDRPARDLAAGAQDLVLGPMVEGARFEVLFQDPFVCLLRAGHPLAKKRLTLERYVQLPHVLVSPTGAGEARVDEALRKLGRSRRVTVRVPHFLAAPLAISESDHVITLPSRVAHTVAPLRRFTIHKPPLTIAPLTARMFWHERNDHDPAHRWLRTLVREIAKKEDGLRQHARAERRERHAPASARAAS